MRAIPRWMVVAVLLCLTVPATPSSADTATNSVIVVFSPDKADPFDGHTLRPGSRSSDPELQTVLQRHHFLKGRALWRGRHAALKNVYFLAFDGPMDLDEAMADLRKLDGVEGVYPNYRLTPLNDLDPVIVHPTDYFYTHDFAVENGGWEPNWEHLDCYETDPAVAEKFGGSYHQWNLPKSNLPRAWGITTGDSTIVVAVMDSGLDWMHPDLMPLIAWNQAELGGGISEDRDGNGYPHDFCGFDFADNDYDVVHDPHWWEDYGCENAEDPICAALDPVQKIDWGWGRNRHGTMMAGLISAVTGTGEPLTPVRGDIAGMNWKTKLLPLKIAPKDYESWHARINDGSLGLDAPIWENHERFILRYGLGKVAIDEQRVDPDGNEYRHFEIDLIQPLMGTEFNLRGYLSTKYVPYEERTSAMVGGVYDPSIDGPLGSIRFEAKIRSQDGTRVRYGALIKQAGNYFVAWVSPRAPLDWQNNVLYDLPASAFEPLPGSSGTPDFSETGTAINLGFIVGHFYEDSDPVTVSSFDIDNVDVWANPWINIDASYPESLAWVIEGINYLIDLKARSDLDVRVLSMSLTFDSEGDLHRDFSIFQDTLWPALRAAGILPVGGAGNWGHCDEPSQEDLCRFPVYPCRDPNVLCASAVDWYGVKAEYAQVGLDGVDALGNPYEGVDICCPATNGDGCGLFWNCIDTDGLPKPSEIHCLAYEPTNPLGWTICTEPLHTLFPEDWMWHITGATPGMTSGATAQAAGLAALVFSAHPELGPDEVEAMIARGARNIDDLNDPQFAGMFGAGEIDAYRTLTLWGTLADTLLSGDVYVSGDVQIPPGVTVTVAPGTRFHIAPDNILNASQIAFWVGGSFQLIGTAADPIEFSGWAETVEPGMWDGIDAYYGANVNLSHVSIRHAVNALSAYELAAVSITDSEIEACSGAGVWVYGGATPVIGPSLSVRSCMFGLTLDGAATVMDVDIDDCSIGLMIMGTPNLEAPGVDIDSSLMYGVAVMGAGEQPLLRNLDIRDSELYGMLIAGSGAHLDDTVYVEGSGSVGIQCDGAPALIDGVTLRTNPTAIVSTNGAYPVIRNCTIYGANYGLNCYPESHMEAGRDYDYGHNEFTKIKRYYAMNGNPYETLYMVGNCYDGSEDPRRNKFLSVAVPGGGGGIVYLPASCD